MKNLCKLGAPFLAFFFVIMWGCPKPPSVTRPENKEIKEAINRLREAPRHKMDASRSELERLARQYPASELADDALLEAARSYLTDEEFDKAIPLLRTILDDYGETDSASRARFLLGLAHYRTGDFATAAEAFGQVKEGAPHFTDASVFFIDSTLKTGEVRAAVERYGVLYKESPERAKELEEDIAAALQELYREELKSVYDELRPTPLAQEALYRLGISSFEEGKIADARDYFTRLLAQYPDDPSVEEARAALEEIESIGKVDSKTIGLILPMSGKWAVYGQKFLDGAAMAVNAFSPGGAHLPEIELNIMDTGGDPEKAAEAARELIVEERVIGIAGPIQRETAQAAARVAQDFGAPIVTMTQLEEITDIGSMVFRNSVTPRDQVKSLVWYATTAMGVKNFAVLYPDHSYGQLFNRVFTEEASKQGATVTLSIPYEPGQSDLRDEIKRISLKQRQIDALFIPDSYVAAATIAPQLTFYNVVRIKLLGSSQWNNPRLIELTRGQMASIEGAVFPAPFFAESTEASVQSFVREFMNCYDRVPDVYEAMGYETVRLMVTRLSETGADDREEFRKALSDTTGFPTFNGYMSAQPDRSFHRPLFLLQVKDGEITDISSTGQL